MRRAWWLALRALNLNPVSLHGCGGIASWLAYLGFGFGIGEKGKMKILTATERQAGDRWTAEGVGGFARDVDGGGGWGGGEVLSAAVSGFVASGGAMREGE